MNIMQRDTKDGPKQPSRGSGNRDEDIMSSGASIVRTKEKFENKQEWMSIYIYVSLCDEERYSRMTQIIGHSHTQTVTQMR